ncbi:GATOR2 complex protein MIOS [Lepeophtheirus salmonis]|uniref:GATOR2 complex protein MIOS n=1 Tax=Lepeophtheirus salmonis TaxID=72036 RepID=UPI001AE6FB8A|nr:GATOR complex protein MIOS-like [Lepeophtheirus salmonis]XP_040571345.1 GATOR complex protein MIOS-like [Lepeophtheirus salmonis]XP_040571346.1 GATOR complex protein MIOS-like [Lepeophtheirus salmonis]
MSYVDVAWIPGSEDRLLTWGSSIKLYRISDDEGCDLRSELEGEIPQPPHYMKCLAPLRAANGEARAVTGGANGRISLLSFDSRSGSVREFGKPASSRAVLGLSWNGNSLLAAAFEKNRNEPALKIFDASPFLASHNHPLGQEHVRSPLGIEYGETCSSLCWINTFGGETLVYGSSGKYLRLIDIRQDSSRGARASTSTRAVYGVTVDPFLDCRIASHVDNQVVIWDTRNFDKPIITHSQNRKITKISWSPTRMGLLCSITDNADSLLLHDIQSWAVIMEDGEPAVTERKLLLEPSVDSQVFTSFVWHPASENTLISTTNKGILKRNVVPERISPSWGARHSLCWPQGGVLRMYDASSELFSEIEDISHVMQVRASQGYGPQLEENMKILSTDAALSTAWKWILTTKQLLENDKDLKVEFPSNSPPGVRTVLKILVPQESSASDTLSEQRSWHGINLLKPRRFYRSTSREKAIKIAGWSSGAGYDNSELISFLESLEKNGEYTRAAAIALFSLDLRLSLTILQRGASNCQSEDKEKATSMRMVSMALSGYTEDKSGLWHEMVPGTNTLVGDPYLQILFTFLMYSQEDYKAILDSDLQLGDKVAFACGYLSDTHLTEYIESNWNQLKEKGNLLGLILCGMRSVESVELLQRYLDITGDIQTVSWMTSKGLFSELILDNPRPQIWINCFRNLLNMWNLWSVRAEFDISVNEILKKPLQQVYVSCNFCGRCIGQHVKTGMPRPLAFVQKQSQLQPFKSNGWLQACSSCRKPLPRCSVCLINMGTMSGLNIHAAPPSRDKPKKISPFKNFFSWCQTCRHGGHALHILDWFKDHAECPVSGCSCKCSVLDGGLLSSNKESENAIELV